MSKQTTEALPPALPSDPALAGSEGFLANGRAAAAAFLEGRGWGLADARPVQALWRPGRSCVVRYRARALDPQGTPHHMSLCVESRARRREPPAPPAEFEARHGLPDPVSFVGPYLVWAFPYDPALPGLADAAHGPAVKEALGRAGERPLAVSPQPLRYRPRRRAVFRYLALHGDGRTRRIVFGKVLPPARSARLLETAGALARAASPRLLPRRPPVRLALPLLGAFDGVLFFPQLAGRSLRDLLVRGGSLPAPERVARLLDDLDRLGARRLAPSASSGGPGDAAVLARAGADLVVRLAPEASGDVERVLEAVLRGAERDPVPPRLVHGDLYEAQVFVGEDFSLGLIDLDGMGPGDPALDAANFCAHLLALGLSLPRAAPRLLAYRTLARRAFLAGLDVPPAALAWREALAMLLLATGPFRVLDPAWPQEVVRRVRLALRLLARP